MLFHISQAVGAGVDVSFYIKEIKDLYNYFKKNNYNVKIFILYLDKDR